jgi:hypothetical protein
MLLAIAKAMQTIGGSGGGAPRHFCLCSLARFYQRNAAK